MRLLLLLVCFIVLTSFSNLEDIRKFDLFGTAQGTEYAITYYATDSLIKKSDIDSLLDLIDLSMSLYKSNSLISQFNEGQTSIKTDKFISAVLNRSFEINEDTKGAFDITVAPLVQAWGFGPAEERQEPSEATIKSILQCVGMKNINLKNGMLSKAKPCIKIDLNGIAQGYSVDLIANFIEEKGINQYVAELGGEIRVSGPKPDGSSLKIGIEGPDENGIPVIRHIVAINTGAITTSGNYRKFHQSGSKKISHLINPKTGYPLNNEMISVTVYANDAITADGYDNSLMAMHINDALNFVEKRKNLEAYFVYKNKNGKITDTLTTGFRKLISTENQSKNQTDEKK
ncbi:FAD:protein FMN transferase [Pedobacter aquatilis]|uniref:FAD:protein FMN transferase n=1 Tax=Pedobacter aquatilis TaxID=351343 RepID=UPI0025B4CFC9|nr:FAD:protein FMN transferase [Pedobacter aquatilis]MDN3588149.1 FAD:protein FMN transferase [Pedobacter aquatilis]